MSFFYDLNKKLDSIRATPEVTHKQLNERDMSRAAKGYEKYGKQGMEALAKAGREGKALDPVRKKYDKYDNNDKVNEMYGPYDDDAKVDAINAANPPKASGTGMKPATPVKHHTYDRKSVASNISGEESAKYDYRGQVDEKVEIYTRGADADWASMSRSAKNPNDPGAVAHRKSAADAARAARTGGDLKFKGQSPVTDIATTGQGRKVQAMKSKDVQEGGSYLNYADSAAENPAPPKKPMAAPAPKPQGVMDKVKSIGNKVAGGINKLVGHGSDEDMRKDVQRKSGAPVTGKKPEQKTTEAAKYRDPKYKDKLYTVEPLDYTYGPDADELYYNPKPDDYEGRKRKIGGGEFSHNDPLRKGFGRGGASNSINTHGKRKGLPSRDQITSLKGSIKDAHGTHAEPNLPEAGAPMTAKQKSFAKLAPPANKITFADKIAGAKKEVDEMLGDVAADAMRKALGKSSAERAQDNEDDFVNDHYAKARNNRRVDAEDDWARSKGRNPKADMDEANAFDYKSPRATAPKVGSIERGAKHDIKHTATGRMVTRRVDDQGNSVGADDASDTQAGPRGRGRPKGTTGAIGAKGPSGRSKLMTKEGEVSTGNLQKMHQLITSLKSYVQDADGQALLKELMGLIKHYATQSKEMPVDEEKTSTRDDRAERAGKKVAKDIEYDEKKKDDIHGKKRGPEDAKAEKAGKKVTKDIEHDEKKKEKEVDESTTSGSVATSTATKSNKGSMVGKGIYDSMNRELENMIAESMSINMSDSTEGNKSLTITATDEDALKLAMILKSAGLGGGDQHSGDMHSHGESPCATCGMPDCGCGDVQEAVDENSPDWPTNTETSPDALQYSGGLNKPKTDVAGDGQTTIPNTAVHTQDEDTLRRMMEMAGIKQADLEPWKETMKEDAEEDATDAENAVNDAEAAEDEIQEDFAESIQRMREIAGIKEAKKDVEEEKTEEGNLFTGNLAKARADGKKQADLDGDGDMEKVRESIFALNNQWRAYKG
jgi:hypothetical protein